jgi:hypothetical protein
MDRGILILIVGMFVMLIIAGMIGFLIYDNDKDKDEDNNTGAASYKWKAGAWSDCDKACGGGEKTRPVTCFDDVGKKTVDLALCKNVPKKPNGTMTCNTRACPVDFEWKRTRWGPCNTTTCKESKIIECVNKTSGQPSESEDDCQGLDKPEPANRDCSDRSSCLAHAQYEWYEASAGPCLPAGCGQGTQNLQIRCRDKSTLVNAPDTSCSGLAKPNTSKPCHNQSCSASWRVVPVGDCIDGTQQRQVDCVGTDRQVVVNDSNCPTPKPANTQTCTSTMPQWSTGSWGPCSVVCGPGGTQTRVVTCPTGPGTCAGTQPATLQQCNTSPCVWGTPSAWSSCNTSGSQTRTVSCTNPNNLNETRPVTDIDCPSSSKPSTSQNCTASWSTGSWGTCSKSCGTGSQTRTVSCLYQDGSNAPLSSCPQGSRPADNQVCNTQACSSTDEYPTYRAFNRQYPVGACGASTCPDSQTCNLANSRWSKISPYQFDKWEDEKITINSRTFQVLRLKYKGCSDIDQNLRCGTSHHTQSLCKKLCEDVDGTSRASLSSIHFTVNHDCLNNPRGGTCYTDGGGNVVGLRKIYIYGPKTASGAAEWIDCGDATFSGCNGTLYSMKINLHVNSTRWNMYIAKYIKTHGLRIALPLSMLKPGECQDWKIACKMKGKDQYPCMITPYMIKEIGANKYGDHDFCPMVPLL